DHPILSFILYCYMFLADTCCGMSLPHKAHPGETVTFTCKYPAKFQLYFKYLYNVTNHNLSVVIYTLGSSVQKGRFSISDHTEKNLFNVSISNLTVKDAGVYLCGAQQIKNGDRKPYYSLFNEMHYSVNITIITITISVSICVVLLLIGGLTLIYYKLRHKKTEGNTIITLRECGDVLKYNKLLQVIVFRWSMQIFGNFFLSLES
uniref:Ig-like domain-containing protein n=1 Tax=Astyanax mexicanus TaxID=7994 RepID=A0A3B1IJV9_ASTMX